MSWYHGFNFGSQFKSQSLRQNCAAFQIRHNRRRMSWGQVLISVGDKRVELWAGGWWRDFFIDNRCLIILIRSDILLGRHLERIDARKSRDMGFFPLKKFQISCLSSKLNVSKEQVWVRWGISCQPPKNTDCDATRLRGKEGGKLPKWSIRGKLPLFQLKYGMRQFWESLQCKGDRAGSDSNFVVQKGLILRKKQLKIPIQWSC